MLQLLIYIICIDFLKERDQALSVLNASHVVDVSYT